jgi:Spy/CpxP family protein refolding chaperone
MQPFERRRSLMRELDLTAEQRDKIAGIRERQAKKAIHARADIQVAAMDLRRLLRADRPDKVAIERQIDTLARMRADLHKSRVESMLEIRSVLTPEQQRKLREMRMGSEG